jgi:hypothetical protein
MKTIVIGGAGCTWVGASGGVGGDVKYFDKLYGGMS